MHATTLKPAPPLRLAGRSFGAQTGLAHASQRAVYIFLLVQFLSGALLIFEELGAYRSYLRVIGFASSLCMFAVVTRFPYQRSYPVKSLGAMFVVIMAIGIFHPNSNTVTSAACQLGINLAVWAPVFWCSRIAGDAPFMRNIVLFFWATSLMSSTVGVLQVYDPDRFAPSPEFIRKMLGTTADGLMINLADGRQIWRPMGLSDSPGGAAIAGAFTVIFGMGIAITERNLMLRLAAVAGAGAGMFCVYICQVRSVFLMTLIGVVVYLIFMTVRQRLNRIAFLVFTIPAVVGGGYLWASSVGGGDVTSRLDTLSDQPAFDVYYKNRGHFIEHTIAELLPEYPMGAGLGRWGSSLSFFGNPDLPNSQPVWVEVQLTAWLLDGGIPLVLVGYIGILLACWTTAKLAVKASDPRIADMAAAISGLNLSLVIITFNYPVFISQMGISFFMMNGLLYLSAGGARQRTKAVAAYV